MGIFNRDERLREFVKYIRQGQKDGKISRRDSRRVRRGARWNPNAVNEELDEFLEDPQGVLEDAYQSILATAGADSPELVQCGRCAERVTANLAKVKVGEMDWEEFFQSLAEFLEVILPVILEVLMNCPA